MKLYKYSVLFLLLCIGLNSCKKGANETIVYGTVFNGSNPAAGIQVDLYPINASTIGSAVTGMDGTYEMVIPDEAFKYADKSHGIKKYHSSRQCCIEIYPRTQHVIIYRDRKTQVDFQLH
ncbi:MAG: hypothetical protein J5606_05570 [Bacteroidales bacterium]|nr:hypothetical protein [Bacteroidales bacterium]